ncbi:ABC transporter substrate-binding protein [Vibrio sp. 03-59-1]|uniref:substrate-binding periplasmic protein n=1 Tax=Vibrio sp. 03-59-1 TaxID=2607607 RepID=UPI0020A3E54F|nr:transporter substrate-binding domain-containing protein [Vibrio sp. 03-59-1]
MRLNRFHYCIFLIALVPMSSIAVTSKTSNHNTVRFAIGEWVPYTHNTPQSGLLEKVVSSAFKLRGYDVTFDYLPWLRSAKLVQHSKYDATFPWYSTDDRRENYLFSQQSILDVKTLLFYHIDAKFDWQSLPDLKQYNIGAVEGYSSTKFIQKGGVETIDAASLEENAYKLYRHRIDAFAVEKRVGMRLIHQISDDASNTIKIHDKPLMNEPMYVLFPKTEKGESLRKVFDSALGELKSSGCYSKILAGEDCV